MKRILLILGALPFLLAGCDKYITQIDIETPDWTEQTHSSIATPDYSVVFPQNKILRFDIEIAADDWAEVEDDLAGMPRSRPGEAISDFEPIWVACGFKFEGKEWYKAGIRVKGNSSLQSTYSSGIKKFSFKLDFNQFAEIYPAIADQRFYGFKQLNLNNNFEDYSLMREKIAGDLFREFGIPSAKSTFCEVFINTGSGSQFYGLYTLVEEVDNTLITTQFDNGTGNLYKPDGTAASFEFGKYSTADLYKKTNDEQADWSDIKALYDALHSNLRTADPAAWRAQLETKMNIDLYIKWLAANTVMQNWDTYGKMTHNFYLYNNPATLKFVWIPWDNNEALQSGKMGGAIDLSLNGVGTQWPFINFIAADQTYFALYKSYAKEFSQTVFSASKMQATYDLAILKRLFHNLSCMSANVILHAIRYNYRLNNLMPMFLSYCFMN